jgi:hypothetical protein
MDARMLRLLATLIDCFGRPGNSGPGHPPTETVRVLATLRRFLREGAHRGVAWSPPKIMPVARPCAAAWPAGPRRACWPRPMPCWSACCAATRTWSSAPARYAPSAAATSPGRIQRTAASGAPSTTSRWMTTAAGRLPGHRGERQRHARLRAAVPGRLHRRGTHPHRVRRQGL